MRARHDSFSGVYDRGRAVGFSDVKNDTMTFRYRDEVFSFPTIRAFGLAHWNGYFYEADIDDIRRLEAAGTA